MFKKDIHYCKDLEYAILGACMIEKDAFGRIYKLLDEDTFYFDGHKIVFKAILGMWSKGIPIDLITVHLSLLKSSICEIEGYNTAWYISHMTNHVVSSAHIEYHAAILKSMYIEREMINITHSGIGEEDGFSAIKTMDKKLAKLREKVVIDDFKGIDEVLVNLYNHMDSVQHKELSGITTGFPTLDKITGGLQAGGMYIVAARPSVGKSAFMGKMVFNAAKKGFNVGVISLEMTDNQIAARISSLATEIEYWRIYRNRMIDETQAEYFYKKTAEISELPIVISDKTGVDIGDIKSKIARLRVKSKIDILFIDYLQLLDTDDKAKNVNREQQVSQISRGLKLLAKDYNIPIVVLAQLNRVSETTGDKKPKLHNLRESGSLEQDADGVIFIHRDYMSGNKEDADGNSTQDQADVIIAKWRDGEVMEYKIGFDGAKMKFYELETPISF
ncbi:MAG: replicative DNA helicase [Chitinophagaceae bacterium]|nr:replicative DNA helicase [Chitinophagaceae bacterium]